MRAFVLHPRLAGRRDGATSERDPQARLTEAAGLARAIGLDVAGAEVVPAAAIHPRTFFGPGRVAELAERIAAEEIGLVVFDGPLTGGQQRNLEKAWAAKVIDRTGLILEIFGARAQSREGALQVELAALQYQRGRLVRSWTHLERQRGGFGFLGGPGETQIEADRRHLDDRITRIRSELQRTTRTRRLHRENRVRTPWPVCALVGYTNAGKSTLFNRLTAAEVFAEDMLFATLDPTMRAFELGGGRQAILSDTVGFISDLPATLVAAFRATLEEVVHADVILHVRDIAHPDTEAQKADVVAVLAELGIDANADPRIIEIANKIDLLDPAVRTRIRNSATRNDRELALSAATGEGCDGLAVAISKAISVGTTVVELAVPLTDGAALSWLYRRGVIHERRDETGMAQLKVALAPADVGRFHKLYGAAG
ncbi:MAG: GTPase HflX [Proteobacteria bacterium]|nr:GTPase HflX [Pseudomonadota bacterium]